MKPRALPAGEKRCAAPLVKPDGQWHRVNCAMHRGRGHDMTADQQAGSEPPPRPFSPHAIHLVRTSVQANMMMSQMADQKASILMGATFVVFTIVIGQARSGAVPVSLAVLAVSAFLSAMCAVYAVLPSVGRGTLPPSANKLFFGHFTAMNEAEWTDAVLEDLHADETVFRTMLHDVYQNGQVLAGKKYRYLGYAYRIFMTGLTATLIVFIAERFVLA